MGMITVDEIRALLLSYGNRQQALADAAKVTQSTVSRWLAGRVPDPAQEVRLRELMAGTPPATEGYRPPPELFGPRDFKVFAAAEGGDGEIVISNDPIETVVRPWYMGEVRDGFAVIITGESMVPAYRPGDMAVINPRLPALRDEPHIFTNGEHASAHEYRATIKHLIGPAKNGWQVEQYNPPKQFVLPKAEWPVALRVVGKYNRR